MQSSISTVAYRGIETLDVWVQVHMSNGLPSMAIVGLADKAVAESKERVRAALSSLGLALPAKRIAVNLSPADLLKKVRILTCLSLWVCWWRWVFCRLIV